MGFRARLTRSHVTVRFFVFCFPRLSAEMPLSAWGKIEFTPWNSLTAFQGSFLPKFVLLLKYVYFACIWRSVKKFRQVDHNFHVRSGPSQLLLIFMSDFQLNNKVLVWAIACEISWQLWWFLARITFQNVEDWRQMLMNDAMDDKAKITDSSNATNESKSIGIWCSISPLYLLLCLCNLLRFLAEKVENKERSLISFFFG